jgi:hypothetical protein
LCGNTQASTPAALVFSVCRAAADFELTIFPEEEHISEPAVSFDALRVQGHLW